MLAIQLLGGGRPGQIFGWVLSTSVFAYIVIYALEYMVGNSSMIHI